MKKIILTIVLSLLLVGGINMFLFNKKEVEIIDLKYMHLGYSTGTMVNSNVRYNLELKDGKYMAEIKPNSMADEDTMTVEMKKEDVQKIKDILKKYHVGRWNGFNKSDQNVLDGDSFSFSIRFVDDTSISASGYMMWPNNYGEVEKALTEIFMSYWNKKTE